MLKPGAEAVEDGGAETPAACCVPPGCACGPPVDLCAAAAAWLQLGDQPRWGEQRGSPTPMGFQQGPLADHAAPSAARTPSAASWERLD